MTTTERITILLWNDPDEPFNRICRDTIEDPALSWTAKGILTYLLGKPKDWIVRVQDLVQHSSQGKFAIRTALQELRDHGYARFTRTRTNGVYNDGLWEISEKPLFSPRTNYPHVGNRHSTDNVLVQNDSTSSENWYVAKPPKDPKPNPNAPSDHAAQSFIDDHCPMIQAHRPDLVPRMSHHNWHKWNKRYQFWEPIRDYQAYLKNLEHHLNIYPPKDPANAPKPPQDES